MWLRLAMRHAWAATIVLAIGGAAPDARAQESPQTNACVAAFDGGQELREAGRLRDAREQLAICADVTCPAPIRAKCVPWLGEVELAMPTLVLAAKDADGHDVTNVRVLSDGVLLVEGLDGRAIAFDPGSFTLRFERPGNEPVEQTLLVREGVKRRLIVVQFPSPKPSPTPPPPIAPAAPPPRDAPIEPPPNPQTLSWLVFVGFGVGAAGLIVGAATGAVALAEFDDIQAQCASDAGCTADDIAAGETVAHVSTAAFVVAGAGVLTGIIALVVSMPHASIGSARIAPTLGIGSFGVAGSF